MNIGGDICILTPGISTKCPKIFGEQFLNYALTIRDDWPKEIICQSLDPWLDQVALPLVIYSFGGSAGCA